MASSLETTYLVRAASAATDRASLQENGINYQLFGAGHAYYNNSGFVSELDDLSGTFRNLSFLKDALFEYHFCRGHEEGEGSTQTFPVVEAALHTLFASKHIKRALQIGFNAGHSGMCP